MISVRFGNLEENISVCMFGIPRTNYLKNDRRAQMQTYLRERGEEREGVGGVLEISSSVSLIMFNWIRDNANVRSTVSTE
jgi:hypothetical protein